jgi:hypothetical protein
LPPDARATRRPIPRPPHSRPSQSPCSAPVMLTCSTIEPARVRDVDCITARA